jgi:hypothetical protein
MSDHWPKFLSERRDDVSESTSPGDAGSEDGTGQPDPSSAKFDDLFLAELVRTVQTTAGLERVRIAEETESRRQEHIDRIRARQSAEAEQMRELADHDKKEIDAWADGERKRIQAERERRNTERQKHLETSLAEHTAKVDRQVEAIEGAIAAYRADVDNFFSGIDRETDLVLIARQATRRPSFPVLDAIGEDTPGDATEAEAETTGEDQPAAEAESETPVVGVMDSEKAEAAESWAVAESAQGAETNGVVEDADELGEPDQVPEKVTSEPGQSRVSGSLLGSVPVTRPMSRFRWDMKGDRSDQEG